MNGHVLSSRYCLGIVILSRRIEVFDCQLISRVGIQKLQRLRQDITVHAYFPPHPPSTPVQNNRRRVTCQCCSLL